MPQSHRIAKLFFLDNLGIWLEEFPMQRTIIDSDFVKDVADLKFQVFEGKHLRTVALNLDVSNSNK